MIDLSLLTEQIAQHFEDTPALDGYHITRSEPFNTNQKIATSGWIGIYKDDVVYEPHTLSTASRRYKGTAVFRIAIQRINMDTGQKAEEFLEKSVQDVLESILSIDRTYIKNFEGLGVEYGFVEDDRETFFFQQAVVTVTVEIVTS